MPHVIVEYSNNITELNTQGLLSSLNQHLIDTGLIQAQDLKSRIHANTDFLIGLGDQSQAYLHMHLYLMQGRSEEQKALIADQAIAALTKFKDYQAQGLSIQLSVQLTEMPIADYRKQVVQR